MKMIKTFGYIIALILTGGVTTQAIEGLHLSLQGNDVILSWPSTNSSYYIVQYSTNLAANSPWQTLTNWMPGADDTNTTYFVHEGEAPDTSTSLRESLSSNDLLSYRSLNDEISSRHIPLAMPRNNPSSVVPVMIYPPGFDFTGYLLFDPDTELWSSGDGITRTLGDTNPPVIPGGFGTNTNSVEVHPPELRFYRVVTHGVHPMGLTNGMTLSGIITIPLEVLGASSQRL